MNSLPIPRSELKASAVFRLLETLSDAMLVMDARGTLQYANPMAQRLLGAQAGLRLAQLVPSLGTAAVDWALRVLRAGPAGAAAVGPAPEARLGDGRAARLTLIPLDLQRWSLQVESSQTGLGDNTGSPHAGVATLPPPRAGSAEGGDLLRFFWDSPFPVTLQDVEFRLVGVNRAFVEFCGRTEAQLVGLDPLLLEPPEDHALARAQRQAQSRGLGPAPAVERRLVDAQGRQRWFRAVRRGFRDENGRTLLLSVLQDTTPEHASRHLAEQSAQELGQWFDLSPLGMVVFDERGQVFRSNPAFETLVGYPAPSSGLSEADAPVQDLLGWSDAAALLNMAPGSPATVREITFPHPDGQRRRLRALLRCVPAPGGGQRFMAVVEDRSLEDERDLARLQLGALVETAGVGLATFQESLGWVRDRPTQGLEGTDPHTMALRHRTQALSGSVSTPAAAPSAGAASLQAIGRDVVEPASLAEFDRLQTALRQGERADVRYAVRHPDVGVRWLQTRVEPGQLGSGQRTTSVVTLDITQQEQSRARGEQLLHELETIIESTPAGIVYLRGDTIVRCNRRFERMVRQPADTLAGAPIANLYGAHPQARALIEDALHSIENGALYETEFLVPARDGHERWYSLSVRCAGTESNEAVGVLVDITRLKSQQTELESLARDRELMFSLSDVGIAFLRGGRIERANEALCRLTGFRAEDIVGLDHARLFQDRADFLRISAQQRMSLLRHGHWSSERLLHRRDGSLLWVQVSKRLVETGQIDGGIIASYVNVDDRRNAQESLVRQAEHTRAILDSVLVGIVTVDHSGIEWMNRSARRMFGGELGDFLGQPMALVATAEPDHPFRYTSALEELEEGQAQTFECQIRARDGRQFWVAGNVVVTGNAATGRQLTYALLDIDRRRQAEAKSERSQASLQRIIESAPMAIALRDAQTLRVLQINQLAARMLGREEADCLDRTLDELYTPESAAQMQADMEAALLAGEVTQREYRSPGDRGDRIWDARYLPLSTRDDEPHDQLLMVATDVTEQREAEQARLDAAIAQREMLVKEVHHRIKNNLQGVAGLLQQIAQRRPEVAAVISEAVGQVQAIAHVYGLQVGAAGPLRVKSVVEAIVGSVQRGFNRTIDLAVEGAAPQRWVLPEAESIPIALILNELLSNAVKHAVEGGLTCTLVCDASEVRIAIANPGTLPEGFDFARVPSGVSGLGLVRALLPRRSATLTLARRGGHVVAVLVLVPPGVSLMESL